MWPRRSATETGAQPRGTRPLVTYGRSRSFFLRQDLTTDGRVQPGRGRSPARAPAALHPGNRVDFDQTFDEHYPPLVRYCHRLLGDRDRAEDIAQEAMVRLFERRVTGSDGGIRGWLFKTATHLVRDRYRVEENRKRLLRENPVMPTDPESPERALERTEARARARQALDALPERDREMLVMRYSGFSYAEIAEAVGVAATSVGTLLARAERRFAAAVADAGEAA